VRALTIRRFSGAYSSGYRHAMNWGIIVRDESGQTSVEYALVIGTAILVALLLSGVLAGGAFQTFWDTVGNALS